MYKTDKQVFRLFLVICMNLCMAIILILPLTAYAINPAAGIGAVKQYQKVKWGSKLVNYGIKGINHSDLALASKSENIRVLLEYERDAGRITDKQVFTYYKKYNSFEKGDEQLLNCLKNANCNIEKYQNVLLKKGAVKLTTQKGKAWFTQKTIAGTINWKNPRQKGNFGEYYTYTMMGRDSRYTAIKLKIGPHGIDHVYLKYNKVTKKIDEIVIIETKTDNAPLALGQMSDEWIKKNLTKIIDKGDNKSRETAKIVLNKLEKEPESVKKMLYRHNLENGTTTKVPLDKNGTVISDKIETSNEYFPMKQRLYTFAKNNGILEE